jgi:hypothetical protein
VRTLTKILIGGVAAASLATGIAVAAETPRVHTLTVQLPGGGVERIQYTGNVKPNVVVLPAGSWYRVSTMPIVAWSPFASFDRISAEMARLQADMNRRMAATLEQARRMSAAAASGSGNVIQTSAGSLPAGTQSYSFVSTMNGSNVCSRMVQIVSRGTGEKPQVISRTSGNCGDNGSTVATSSGASATAIANHPAPRSVPRGSI